MAVTPRDVTERDHRAAHGQLRTAAALLKAGRITRDEWFRRVDPVLARFEQRATVPPPTRPETRP